MQRPHRGGEPRYLADAMRPLWSFTQPPNPDYFALLGALFRMEDGLDTNRITREALADLLRAAGLSPEDPASPMGVFDLAGSDAVSWPLLYRHLLLPEQARTLDILREISLVAGLMTRVKRLFLKNGAALSVEELVWPPRSAKHSVEPAIDVAALNALVHGDGPSGAAAGDFPDASRTDGVTDGREPPLDRPPGPAGSLSLTILNDSSELERVAAAVDEFADLHRFKQQDRFQVQLCIEEILMYIVGHGYDDAGAHRIEIRLEMNDEQRSLAIGIVDDGRELEPESIVFQPGPDTIQEETVVEGLGLHLVRTYVDDLQYRRENSRNYLSLSKRIGN